ncbi:hypothetical protein ACNOYE_01225 [Nannocystaceae bacterium ST9]
MTHDELDSRERGLLDAYRDHHAMPAEARERVLAGLIGPLGPSGGGGSAIDSAAEPWVTASEGVVAANGWSRPSWVAGAGLLVAAGITLIVLGVGGAWKRDRGEPLVVESGHAAPVASTTIDAAPELPAKPSEPANVQPIVEPEPTPLAESTSLAEASPRSLRPRARAREAAPTKLASPSLGRERELIEQAHAALAEGDTAAAIAVLDEHARDFAEGVFAEERDGIAAIARCKAGQLELGQARAHEFLAAHPRAVLAGRVRRTCNLEGSASEVP